METKCVLEGREYWEQLRQNKKRKQEGGKQTVRAPENLENPGRGDFIFEEGLLKFSNCSSSLFLEVLLCVILYLFKRRFTDTIGISLNI